MDKLQSNLLIKGTYKWKREKLISGFSMKFVCSMTQLKLRSDPIKTVPIKLMAIIYGSVLPYREQSTFI